MAFPSGLYRMEWVFNFASTQGNDVQEFGLFFASVNPEAPPTDENADLQALADAGRNSWNTEFGPLVSFFSSAVSGNTVKSYVLDSSLHATNSAASAFSGGSAFVGTSSTGLPAQNSLVVTTLADDPTHFVPHRANRRGRFYLPTMGESILSSAGFVTTGNRTSIAAAANAFVSGIDPILSNGAGVQPIIVSRKLASVSVMQYTGVGLLVDTQRRRRNKLVESTTYSLFA